MAWAVICISKCMQDMNVKEEGDIKILTHMCEQTRCSKIFKKQGLFSVAHVMQDAAPVNQYENTPLVLSLAPPGPTSQPQKTTVEEYLLKQSINYYSFALKKT